MNIYMIIYVLCVHMFICPHALAVSHWVTGGHRGAGGLQRWESAIKIITTMKDSKRVKICHNFSQIMIKIY